MRIRNTSLLVIAICLFLGLGGVAFLPRTAQVQAQAASAGWDFLDPSFNGDGRVIIPVPGTNEIARDVAIQPDGKLIIAGYDNWLTADKDVILARVNPDGGLDGTFGAGGVVTTSLSGGDDTAYAVAVQPDGKIVAAGLTQAGGHSAALAMRYNADGSLDTGFGTGGVVTTGFPSASSFFLGVAVLDDGRIVAGGSVTTNPATFLLARYQSNGALDTTLGGTGFVTTTIPGGDAYGWDMAIQPDGKIVLAGYFRTPTGGGFALARYNTDGSLDAGFGAGGIVTQSLSSTTDYAYGVNVQSSGKIVMGGQTAHAGALARYNADGSYDNSFGPISSLNYVTTTVPGYDSATFIETALQADDSIVAATRASGGPPIVGIAVFDQNGLPKTGLGPNGVITTTNEGHSASDYALLVQPDGKIVLAGNVDLDDSDAYEVDMALWRYILVQNSIYLPLVVR